MLEASQDVKQTRYPVCDACVFTVLKIVLMQMKLGYPSVGSQTK